LKRQLPGLGKVREFGACGVDGIEFDLATSFGDDVNVND